MKIKGSHLRGLIREELRQIHFGRALNEEVASDNPNAELVGEIDDDVIANVGMGSGWRGKSYYVWINNNRELGSYRFSPGDPYTYEAMGNDRYRVISGPHNPKSYPSGRTIGTNPIGKIFTIKAEPVEVEREKRTWFMVTTPGADDRPDSEPIISGQVGSGVSGMSKSAITRLEAGLKFARLAVENTGTIPAGPLSTRVLDGKISTLESLLSRTINVQQEADVSTSPRSLGQVQGKLDAIIDGIESWLDKWLPPYEPNFEIRLVSGAERDVKIADMRVREAIHPLQRASLAITTALSPPVGAPLVSPNPKVGTVGGYRSSS